MKDKRKSFDEKTNCIILYLQVVLQNDKNTLSIQKTYNFLIYILIIFPLLIYIYIKYWNKNDSYNNLEADIIDVNNSLFLNKVNIIDLINNGLNDISGNIKDVSGNINNKINDISGNINDLWDKITELKESDIEQNTSISELETLTGEHTTQIEANTGAISTLTTQTDTNTAAIATETELLAANIIVTGTNTATLGTLVTAVGIPSILGITPATGLFAAVDGKLNRSAFGSCNIGIFNVVFGEYVNLVYIMLNLKIRQLQG